MYVEYELHCSCGAQKTEQTRVDIIQWLIDHVKSSVDFTEHSPKILWRYNQRVRELSKEEIIEFIDYIESGKMEEQARKYPFGMPGLGHGPNRAYSRYGIPR